MNQVLLMLLLVSVFGSQGKSVSDTSYGSGKFIKGSPTNDIQPQSNISKEQFFFAESSTTERISTTVSQEENQKESDQESSDTSVYNRVQNPTDNESSIDDSSFEEEEPDGPVDHAIPYSEHEEPRNVPTKPKYTAPGEWAKPPKDKKVHLEFVPTKLYAQVRKTHTLRKLPRKKAIENADSEEEKENASRLRAVVKNTKVNTVYTEEGYEDSAYDHAGHIRDADFHEGYARKLHDHSDLKKKSGDDDTHEKEENETKDKNYKKIKPEEFKEFEEDDSDPPKTSATSKIVDNVLVNPKLVAEKGIEKLQDDLEREVEEMEKGIEISKLEKVETTTDMEISAESRKRDNYDKMKERRKKTDKKRRKLSSSENVENSTAASMNENIISTDRTTDTTSVTENVEKSELHKYKIDGKSSPNVDIIDFTRTEENPTTVSYGQLFWDYFKTRQDQSTTTEFPLISESTTLNQNLEQSSYIKNLNNFEPYSVYEETTTMFPTMEPEILGVQEIKSGHSSMDSAYLKNNGQSSELLPVNSESMDELWQSINSNEQLKMESPSFSFTHGDKIFMNDQEISFLNSQKILNSNEEFNQNFDSSLFNPTLSSVNNRKPRYKITIRNKPKEPQKPSNLNIQSSNQESSTSSIINKPLTDMTTTKKPVPMNENYMKVLMHVKNEKNLKNVQHQHPNSLYRNPQHPNSLQPNNLFLSNTETNLEDLTILRPPLPQKAPDYYYYNVVPRSKPEIDATLSDWSSIPGSQQRRQVYTNPRMYRFYFDLPQVQRHPLNRKRNTKPASDLIRGSPPPQKDLIWHNEPMDYVNRGGNGSKQGRNVLRPFRQASNLDGVHGIRAKRRKRRFVGVDDESDIVKGSMVNNGTSNRGEIERAAKNPSIERNCSQKVTRGLEVGPVLDTSQAKQFEEKKSRHCGNDWGEESRVVERESIVVNGYNGRNGYIKSNLRAPRYDDGKKEEGNVIYLVRKERDVGKKDFKTRNELKEREELLDETSKVSGRKKRELNVIDLVRKRKDVEKDDSNMTKELKQRIELSNKTFQVTDGQKEEEKVIDSVGEKKDVHEEVSKIKDELNVHAKLLDEAPTITEDVINQEIYSRFNEETNESKEDDDTKINKGKDDESKEQIDVDVEVPEFDYVEELTEEDHADESIATTEATINTEKYPFYNNEKMPTPSALKYAIDPKRLPTKTYGAMDFYNSRDAYMQCDEVEPNLKVLPEKEEPVRNKDPEGNLPRLKGLGDKLDCFKAKYFDEDPFDNPLFLEKQVEDPVPPAEINGKQFVSRIMMLPREEDDYVIQKSSRRPENYRQLRKYISNPVVAQKTRRIRYKIYPRTMPKTRRRPESYRVQSSRTKYTKNSKRPQKIERRPVTSASEISSIKLSDSIPYQSQVYEDVMGTIKNLANSYQVREMTTMPASEEITLMDDTVVDVKTNSSTNSTSYRKKEKEKNSVSIDIMDRPSDMRINIKGPMPTYQNRYRQGVYKRIIVPQKSRLRIQPVQKPVIGIRTVKRRRKVRIYKRDLKDDLNSSSEKKLLVASIELGSQSAEKKENKIGNRFLKWKESDYQLRNLENSTIENDKDSSTQEDSMTSNKLPKTIDTKRKSKIPKSVTINSSNNKEDHVGEESQKVVYTIKDRIRYSKPKGDLRNVGKFVNKTMVEEDKRRSEPRYNYIRRKNPSNLTLTTTESSSLDLTNKINWTETVTTTDKVIELDSQEITKENREVEYTSNNTKNDYQNKSENFNNFKHDLINQSNEEDANKTGSGYAVYESVNEGEVITTQKPQLSTSTEFFNLRSFLDTDPPKYAELANEDFQRSFSLNTTNSSNGHNKTSDSTNFNETQKGDEHEKEKDEDTSKPFHQSYFSNEESSEKAQTETKVQSSTESSEESSVASKESESEEDRTYFSYTSRPSSPAENYEDEKYSQLGPRINKPAFYHPPFFNYKRFHPKGNSEETQESNEEKEEYVFPWYKDKEDRRKRRRSRYRDKMNYEYEYPWERRERLAREERKREAEKRKGLLRKFDDEEEEAEEAAATKYRTNTYPRGRYRFWGRIDSDSSEDRTSDNIESSSEYRPIMRYSSRYNSRNIKLPLDKQSTNIKSRSIEEISRSIKKTLEDDSEEKGTLEETKNDSSQEKKLEGKESVTSYKSRGISRGMIVPEDVTLVPSRKTRNREKSIDNSSMDTLLENRNSSELVKNTLDNSEPRITVVESPREIENSTKQTSKKRRRPSKNAISTMETVTKSATEANRARRRQKPSSTTVATVESTSLVATTTSASKIARRRNQKSKDSKKNYISNVLNKSVNEASNETDTSSKTGTAEQHSRGRKKNQTNELVNELAKNDRNKELSIKSSTEQEHLEKVNDGGGKNPGNETIEEKLVNVNQNKEAEESKRIFLPVKSDERFDFKDARIETLSDFDKSHDDYEIGSILKTDTNFIPQNRALQLTEQSSREIISTVSWISENYDF